MFRSGLKGANVTLFSLVEEVTCNKKENEKKVALLLLFLENSRFVTS